MGRNGPATKGRAGLRATAADGVPPVLQRGVAVTRGTHLGRIEVEGCHGSLEAQFADDAAGGCDEDAATDRDGRQLADPREVVRVLNRASLREHPPVLRLA